MRVLFILTCVAVNNFMAMNVTVEETVAFQLIHLLYKGCALDLHHFDCFVWSPVGFIATMYARSKRIDKGGGSMLRSLTGDQYGDSVGGRSNKVLTLIQ